MKYLLFLLANLAALAFIDAKYTEEIARHYAETVLVLEKYCVPSAILQGLER
jgi:hypothetical protein